MGGSNFIQKIIDSLFGGGDPEAEKKRRLRTVLKNYNKTKYRFYKSTSHEVQPALGKYFYEIYKAVSPSQIMFQTTSPAALKNLVINASLTEKQRALIDGLAEDKILEATKGQDIAIVEKMVQDSLEQLSEEFDESRIAKIDNLYNKISLFKNFVTYDFYFMVKKFTSGLKEHSFNTEPVFAPITAAYVADDLKDFLAVAWVLPFDQNWDDMFKLLREIRGIDPMPPKVWQKILNRLRNAKDKKVFEYLIQLITENPDWSEDYKNDVKNIVDEYISSVRKSADETLRKIQDKLKSTRVESLLIQIFGTDNVPSLHNYIPSNGQIYAQKGLGGFEYSQPLSYLKQFLLNYTKKEIRELNDILVIRGEWSNSALSKPLSESFHDLMDISSNLIAFDDKLAESSDYGTRLKTFLPRTERDRDARNIVGNILTEVNDTAATFLLGAINDYITFAKNLKMCLEDFVKSPRSELILNWRDLDRFAEGQLRQRCIEVYKKIFAFVTLLQQFKITRSEKAKQK